MADKDIKQQLERPTQDQDQTTHRVELSLLTIDNSSSRRVNSRKVYPHNETYSDISVAESAINALQDVTDDEEEIERAFRMTINKERIDSIKKQEFRRQGTTLMQQQRKTVQPQTGEQIMMDNANENQISNADFL